ncbi:MAG TPA: hypothetical protein VHL09_10465 [Dehalococcoidia bacterium]|nr:hypothetical protein [Dehalococcoidia bacterium]
MARFVAVSDAPGITADQFRQAFDAIRKWRFDKRAWIVKAYADLNGGKLFIECEARDRGQFEEWLGNTNWQVNAIHEIDLIHEAGTVWPMRGSRAS